jgi:nicotinamidase-related amidase
MPATAIDPNTALVVIDLQKGLSAFPLVHPFADVLAQSLRLLDAFRLAKLPVFLVNVSLAADGRDTVKTRADAPFRMPAAKDFAELVPELEPRPSDVLITKHQPNAFYGTELDLQLRRRRVTGIVLAGVATSGGVEATGRAAHERAFNVTFASDAMTDMDETAHNVMLTRLFPRMGEVDKTDAILALLPR